MYFIVDAPNIETLLKTINTIESFSVTEDELFDSPSELIARISDIAECDYEATSDGQKLYFIKDYQIKTNFPIYKWLDRTQVSAVLDSAVTPNFTIL